MEQETTKEKVIARGLLFGPILILALFIGASFVHPVSPSQHIVENRPHQTDQSDQQVASTVTAVNESTNKPVSNSVSIIARAAFVQNLRTGEVLYAKNENERLPLASLTKLMTALVVSEKVSNDTIVQISPIDIATEGTDTLYEGERWNLKNLRDLTLVSSSNDGASALAAVGGFSLSKTTPASGAKNIFIAEMNQKAEDLELTNMYFYNESGLDQLGRAGAFGSAKDVAKLFNHILETDPEIVEATKEATIFINSADGFQHVVHNTNYIVNELPNIIASKTGYTEEAGGNLAVVLDAGLNDPVVLVVLGSTLEGRFEDIKTLTEEFITKEINK